MSDFSVIQQEVLEKLSLINNLYFKNDSQFTQDGFLGGQSADPASGLKSSLDSSLTKQPSKNINQLFNFNTTDSDTTANNFIKTKTGATSIFTRTGTSEYVEVQLSNVSTIDPSVINDINCLSLLEFSENSKYDSKNNIYLWNDSAENNIYTFMQGLYSLYNLFEPNTWENYLKSIKSDITPSITFKIPQIKRSGTSPNYKYTVENTKNMTIDVIKKYYINKVSNLPDLIDTIYTASSFNPFVARRLILMWILLSNYLIAITYYENNKNNSDPNISDLVAAIYNLIVQTNQNIAYNSIDDYRLFTDSDIQSDQTSLNIAQLKLTMFDYAINKNKTDNAYIVNSYNNDGNIKQNSDLEKQYNIELNNLNITDDIKKKVLNIDGDKDSVYNVCIVNNILREDNSKVPKIRADYNSKIYAIRTAIKNKDSSIGSSKDVLKSLNTTVSDYADIFHTSQDGINNISELLETGKTNLVTIQNLLNGRISIQKTQKICEYIAMIIMIIFSLLGVSIIIVDFDKNKKLYGCIGLIVFSLINFLGIQTLLNSSIFVVKASNTPIVDTFAVAQLKTVTSMAFTNTYNIAVMQQVSKFLDNTMTMATLLNTYKAYGNINSSMQKELGYYNQMVSQIKIAQEKMNNIYYASYINTVDVSALLQLFQILTIIIAATCTGIVLTQDIEGDSIKKWIIIIASILSVFAIIIYLMEINQRVHTNPSKYYWANPSSNTFSS